uniref:Uncharacterized protein n=1 Tax=Zea mays TaxID=4577 RepID=C4J5B4_MAIZE|nr:unknown [Zea mays]
MPGHTVAAHLFTNVNVAALPPLEDVQIRTGTTKQILVATPMAMASKQCSSTWCLAMAIGTGKKGRGV